MERRGTSPTLALAALAFAATAIGQESPDPAVGKAIARAGVHNTRVLAVLAPDGEDLATAWKRDKALGRLLMYEFEVVQLTGAAADAFATRHGFTAAVEQKPAAVVLDQDGRALAQLLPPLVEADSAAFAAALKGFACAPADAEAKLAAALVDAKQTGRNVFVRFDAPW